MNDKHEPPLVNLLRVFARDPEMSDNDLSICCVAADEIERLAAWKADALLVLNRWDNAYERAAISAVGNLGRYKSDVMADEILRLRARIRELDEALSEAEHKLGNR